MSPIKYNLRDRHRIDSNPGDISPSNSIRLEKANALARKLRDSNPEAVWFYYMVLGKLDEDTIDRYAIAAIEKKTSRPGAYFNRCVMNKIGAQ